MPETGSIEVTLSKDANRRRRPGVHKGWLAFGILAAIAPVLVVVLFQAYYLPSGAMEDTLQVGDRLLANRAIWGGVLHPEFQDILVFHAPPAALQGSQIGKVDFVKRCVGLPGDTVYVQQGKLYRKAKGESAAGLVNEPYVKWSPPGGRVWSVFYDMKIVNGRVYSREYGSGDMEGPWSAAMVPAANQQAITAAAPGPIPVGQYLFLGDHRNNSNDGHIWGFVPRANIHGKAFILFWPLDRITFL